MVHTIKRRSLPGGGVHLRPLTLLGGGADPPQERSDFSRGGVRPPQECSDFSGGGVCGARVARDFYVFRPSNHSFPMHFADPERCARSQRGCHERGDGGRGRLEPSPPIAHGSAVAPTVQVPRSVGGRARAVRAEPGAGQRAATASRRATGRSACAWHSSKAWSHTVLHHVHGSRGGSRFVMAGASRARSQSSVGGEQIRVLGISEPNGPATNNNVKVIRYLQFDISGDGGRKPSSKRR